MRAGSMHNGHLAGSILPRRSNHRPSPRSPPPPWRDPPHLLGRRPQPTPRSPAAMDMETHGILCHIQEQPIHFVSGGRSSRPTRRWSPKHQRPWRPCLRRPREGAGGKAQFPAVSRRRARRLWASACRCARIRARGRAQGRDGIVERPCVAGCRSPPCCCLPQPTQAPRPNLEGCRSPPAAASKEGRRCCRKHARLPPSFLRGNDAPSLRRECSFYLGSDWLFLALLLEWLE